MDSLTRKRSFLDHVTEILLLPFILAYAATEILVSLLWSLVVRTLQELYSLVLHIFHGICKQCTRNPQLRLIVGHASEHFEANAEASLHYNKTNSLFQQHAETRIKSGHDVELDWSSQNKAFIYRKETNAERKRLETEKEHSNVQSVNTKVGKDERTLKRRPCLVTTQWVIHKNPSKVKKNKANTDEEDKLQHRNSNAHCRGNSEDKAEKQVAYYNGKMFLLHSEHEKSYLGENGSDVGLTQEVLDCKLRKRKTNKGDFELPFGRSTKEIGNGHLRLKTVLRDSRKKNVMGCKQSYKPLPDWSGIAKEKYHAVFSGQNTNEPAIATETPATASQVKMSSPSNEKVSNAEVATSETKRYHSLLTDSPSRTKEVNETPSYQAADEQNNKLQRARHQQVKLTKTAQAIQTDASKEAANFVQGTSSNFQEAETRQVTETQNYKFLSTQDQIAKIMTATTAKVVRTDTYEEATTEEKLKSSPITDYLKITFTSQEKLLDNAPTITALKSNSVTRVVQEGSSSCRVLRDKGLRTLCGPTYTCSREKQAEATQTVNTELDQSHNNIVVQKSNKKIPGKFNLSPPPWTTQQENQKMTRAVNSSKFRQEQIKRSRLPFARASRKMNMRKDRMPVL